METSVSQSSSSNEMSPQIDNDPELLSELALSATMSELAMDLSDISTLIFEIQELRHANPADTSSPTTNANGNSNDNDNNEPIVPSVDTALIALEARLEEVSKQVDHLRDRVEPSTAKNNNNSTTTTNNNNDPPLSASSISSSSFEYIGGDLDNSNSKDNKLKDNDQQESTLSPLLQNKWNDIKNDWTKIESEVDTLRDELKEDKWLVVFRTVGQQAEDMMDSLEKVIVQCHEFVWDVHRHTSSNNNNNDAASSSKSSSNSSSYPSDSPDSLQKLLSNFILLHRSFHQKSKYYTPSTERVLKVLDKGITERSTKNGEVLRRFADMKSRWRNIKERMNRISIEMDSVQEIFKEWSPCLESPTESIDSSSSTTAGPSTTSTTTSSSLNPPKSSIRQSISPLRRFANRVTPSSSSTNLSSKSSPSTPVTPRRHQLNNHHFHNNNSSNNKQSNNKQQQQTPASIASNNSSSISTTTTSTPSPSARLLKSSASSADLQSIARTNTPSSSSSSRYHHHQTQQTTTTANHKYSQSTLINNFNNSNNNHNSNTSSSASSTTTSTNGLYANNNNNNSNNNRRRSKSPLPPPSDRDRDCERERERSTSPALSSSSKNHPSWNYSTRRDPRGDRNLPELPPMSASVVASSSGRRSVTDNHHRRAASPSLSRAASPSGIPRPHSPSSNSRPSSPTGSAASRQRPASPSRIPAPASRSSHPNNPPTSAHVFRSATPFQAFESLLSSSSPASTPSKPPKFTHGTSASFGGGSVISSGTYDSDNEEQEDITLTAKVVKARLSASAAANTSSRRSSIASNSTNNTTHNNYNLRRSSAGGTTPSSYTRYGSPLPPPPPVPESYRNAVQTPEPQLHARAKKVASLYRSRSPQPKMPNINNKPAGAGGARSTSSRANASGRQSTTGIRPNYGSSSAAGGGPRDLTSPVPGPVPGDYVPVKHDLLDVAMARAINSQPMSISLKRIDKPVTPQEAKILGPNDWIAKYEIDGLQIMCKLVDRGIKGKKVMVRYGGGWHDMDMYLLNQQASALTF